jgi:GH24 family phage-related lysozyme (muramidase)
MFIFAHDFMKAKTKIFFFFILVLSCEYKTTDLKKLVVLCPQTKESGLVKLAENIKQYETLLLYPQKQGAFFYIGYGHQLFKEYLERITPIQAEALLYKDILKTQATIKRIFKNLNENQTLALSSFCYQYGITFFLKSNLCRQVRQGKYIKDILTYCKHNDKVNQGYLNRRAYELYLFYKTN